jgi:hypothetical protein
VAEWEKVAATTRRLSPLDLKGHKEIVPEGGDKHSVVHRSNRLKGQYRDKSPMILL